MVRLTIASVGAVLLQTLCATEVAASSNVEYNAVNAESMVPKPYVHNLATQQLRSKANNSTLPAYMRRPTKAEREMHKQARRKRQKERNERTKEVLKRYRPDPGMVEMVSAEEVNAIPEDHPVLRGLGWMTSSTSNAVEYADPGQDYDMWQQAYRMLGGFIDCDHQKSEGDSHDDNQNNGNNGDGEQQGCSRWMMWAAYIDPNYEGGGYDEYHADEPTGTLDCHNPDSEWVLLGVYRQEFYQFIEQISKHLWALDDDNYIIALAGLAYMTDSDCFYVGNPYGEDLYAGVQPLAGGKFQMELYTDTSCLVPGEDLGMTFDDFGLYSDVSLGSGDKNGDGDGDGANYDDDGISSTWQATQEYTLTMLNEVYEDFKYCTSCIDYPTYQDGYLIGDTGTDEDDLINQCWKFYSHDSFNCETDCIALGHSQGTIASVVVGDKMYGQPLQGYFSEETASSSATGTSSKSSKPQESQLSRLLANAFVTFSFIVFVATFLAFAVARRSRYRESRSSKTRRLLDQGGRRSSRSRSRRSSRTRKKPHDEDADGLFRGAGGGSSARKSRSKSGTRRSRTSGRSSSRAPNNGSDYEPPRRSASRKRSGSRSRRRVDDF